MNPNLMGLICFGQRVTIARGGSLGKAFDLTTSSIIKYYN
jgi:hypothetical protein